MLQVIQYQKTGEMFVEELPAPKLKDGGVLVQNLFSLISAGTERSSVETAQASMIGKARSRPDLVKQVMDNVKREGLIATFNKVQNRLDNYKELGYSSAGVVIESSVDDFTAGDRIACAGVGYASHAETVFVPKNLVAKIPDEVSSEEAAFTTLGAIALQGVRQADLRVGEQVAVIGLGLLGLITVQLLKASGCKVIGLDISPSNFDLAKNLGCDSCCVSNSEAVKEVESFTRSYGTDAVLITAATTSNDPVELAIEFARKKSKIVVVGAVGMNIPRSPFYEKELDFRISCSYGPGRYDPNYEEKGNDYPISYVRWTEQRNMEAVLDLIAQKKLDTKSLVTHTFNVERALEAYDLITGKIKERYLGILIKYPQDQSKGEALRHRINFQPINSSKNGKRGAVIGFIGAGNHAQSYLIPPLQKYDARLRAVVTSKPVNAKSTGRKFNFEYCATDPNEIFNDQEINSVFVASRHDSHAKYVIAALKQRKSIFVEKPLAISESQLDEIIAAYNEATAQGRAPILMVGYNRRFSPPVRAMKDHFSGRKEPLVISYRVSTGFLPKTNWYQSVEQGGRVVGEIGHFIDTLQFLTDSLPVKVYAVAPVDTTERYSSDNVSISINFSDGSIGIINYLANGSSNMDKEYLEVFGDCKTATMENFKRVNFFADRKKWEKKFAGGKGHTEEIQAVLECIKSGGSAPIDIESLFATTRASFAIMESLRKASAVEI